MKQETIEEVAERLTENAYQNEEWETGRLKRIGYYQGLIEGAKWQAKRMYSDEDLAEAFEAGKKVGEDNACMAENYRREDFKEWFEKFKKK